MKLKQSRHPWTSCEPLLGRILNHVTLLNLIRILHNKGGKLYGTSLHFCYVEACRKSHNVGVQHLLIGFRVVTMFLRATLGRTLTSVCRAFTFQGGKLPINYVWFVTTTTDDVTLICRNISASRFTFQTFSQQISVACFALQAGLLTDS